MKRGLRIDARHVRFDRRRWRGIEIDARGLTDAHAADLPSGTKPAQVHFVQIKQRDQR